MIKTFVLVLFLRCFFLIIVASIHYCPFVCPNLTSFQSIAMASDLLSRPRVQNIAEILFGSFSGVFSGISKNLCKSSIVNVGRLLVLLFFFLFQFLHKFWHLFLQIITVLVDEVCVDDGVECPHCCC